MDNKSKPTDLYFVSWVRDDDDGYDLSGSRLLRITKDEAKKLNRFLRKTLTKDGTFVSEAELAKAEPMTYEEFMKEVKEEEIFP